MKKPKQILALAAVVILAIVALLPLAAAMVPGEKGKTFFMAAIALAIFVPVLAFAMLFAVKFLNAKSGNTNRDFKENDIDTIIFDVGNVLIDFNGEKFMSGCGFEAEKKERISKAIFGTEAWDLRDRGTVSDEEILRQYIAGAPEYEEEIRSIFGRLHECLYKVDYAETWVKYLKKKGYKVYILSNFCETLLNKVRKDIPEQYVDGAVWSYEVKMMKPEKEIYEYLLDTYQINPKKAVFIDDRRENLTAAEKKGIHTVQFKNFRQAVEDLKKLGVDAS